MNLSRAQLDHLFQLADKLAFELGNIHEEDKEDSLAKELYEKADFIYTKIDDMRCDSMEDIKLTKLKR